MFIVFTDLDGTLLDYHTYSFSESLEGMNILRERAIPLVLCSSKTAPEIREIHGELNLDSPFIFENGAGIYYSRGAGKGADSVETSGRDIDGLKGYLSLIKKTIKREIRLMLDMDIQEIITLTGLSRKNAGLSKQRMGSIPFVIKGTDDISPDELSELNGVINKHGIAVTRGGRFFHLSSIDANKGRAVSRVVDFYRSQTHDSAVTSIGIGDSPNDIPMLEAVDIPFLVKRPDGTAIDSGIEKIRITEKAGPAGFTEAMKMAILK